LKWEPGQVAAGRSSYIGDYDERKLIAKLTTEEEHYNCMEVKETANFIRDLANKRTRSARAILEAADCDTLAKKIPFPTNIPHTHTLKRIAERIGFRVCTPQYLDDARRKACDKEVITDFFAQFGHLFDRDPRLIFNMDETMLDSRKEFKVLAKRGKLPLKKTKKRPPHLTGVCAFSARGHVCKPMIILPPMKKYIDVQDLGPGAYVCRSETGWMNKEIFLNYAEFFCADISRYRLELPESLRDQPILLVLDGHLSRLCWEAMAVFRRYQIEVLVLPGHTSHLLQPFDIAVASPLKSAYHHLFAHERAQLEEQWQGRNIPIHYIRYAMCRAFLGAYAQAVTLQNAEAGFMSAGMVPFNPEKPKESEFCPDATAETRLYRSQLKAGLANNRLLTSDEDFRVLRGGAEFSVAALSAFLTTRKKRVLSVVPTIIVQIGRGRYEETNLDGELEKIFRDYLEN
jgi:hypothetical protein